MSFRDQTLKLRDAEAMRALAHPVRIALLDYLFLAGPATATQCAAVVGGSPQACSYHLRTLAKYGLVEESTSGDGRERPWRIVVTSFSWRVPAGSPPDRLTACTLLNRSYLDRDEQLLNDFLACWDALEPAWQDAVAMSRSTVYATAEQLRELRDRIDEVIAEYVVATPGDRPTGAQPVHVVFRAFPRRPVAPTEPDTISAPTVADHDAGSSA